MCRRHPNSVKTRAHARAQEKKMEYEKKERDPSQTCARARSSRKENKIRAPHTSREIGTLRACAPKDKLDESTPVKKHIHAHTRPRENPADIRGMAGMGACFVGCGMSLLLYSFIFFPLFVCERVGGGAMPLRSPLHHHHHHLADHRRHTRDPHLATTTESPPCLPAHTHTHIYIRTKILSEQMGGSES